jgi:O-antigen/teichoic acid export membrane protein
LSVLKKFAGQTMLYGLSTIVARVLNFLLTPLYVRLFPTHVYGIFTNMYAWAAMLNALLAFGMETTYFRFLQKHQDKPHAVFSNSFLITVATSFVFMVSLFSCSPMIATWLNKGVYDADYERYIHYFGFILVADALAIVPFSMLRAQNRAVRFVSIKITNIVVMVALNLLLIVWVPQQIAAGAWGSEWMQSWYREGWIGYVFLSNLFASVLTFLLLLPQLFQIRWQIDWSMWKSMLAYSFPILIANISFIINELVDKMYFIPKLVPGTQADVDLGIYGAVSKMAIFLSLMVQAFRLGAEPFFFSVSKEGHARKTYAVIMDYFVICMVVAMVGVVANLDWLKHFIRSADPVERVLYWSGLKVVPILLLSYVFLGIYMNLSIWYKLTDQTKYAFYISGIGALCTIVLNYWLVPSYSYVAAAWVTLIAYILMVVLSYLWGQKHYAVPYKVGKNLLYIGIGILVSVVIYFGFHGHIWWSNLLWLSMIGVIAMREYKELFRLMKEGI